MTKRISEVNHQGINHQGWSSGERIPVEDSFVIRRRVVMVVMVMYEEATCITFMRFLENESFPEVIRKELMNKKKVVINMTPNCKLV